jgi:hypothetical protein
MNTETKSIEEIGWDKAYDLARRLGSLQGTTKVLLEYGNLEDRVFKTLAEGLIGVLDSESENDTDTHMWIMALAEKRNIELNA